MRQCLKIVWGLSLFHIGSVFADSHLLTQPAVKAFVQEMVTQEHLSRAEVEAALSASKYRADIIEKMDKPYEAKPWDVYAQLFLTSSRIQAGADFWKKNHRTLHEAEAKYGVPAQLIVSILGVETLYGQRQGDFRVLDALSTLAFYYPKRAPYFQYELKQYLLMCHQHHLNPTKLKGSYAGAMGQGQFMPSSYRRWAVSYDGQHAPDIIHNTQDAIFSIANYLHAHGWKKHQMVAEPAKIKQQFCQTMTPNLKKATYQYRDLTRCGVSSIHSHWFHPRDVGLLELDVAKGHEYWIGYPNFYVILTYNSSPLYGLAVYLLSESIAQKV